jgi:hypothetical protein
MCSTLGRMAIQGILNNQDMKFRENKSEDINGSCFHFAAPNSTIPISNSNCLRNRLTRPDIEVILKDFQIHKIPIFSLLSFEMKSILGIFIQSCVCSFFSLRLAGKVAYER